MSCATTCNSLGTHESVDACLATRSAGGKDVLAIKCMDNITDISDPQQLLDAVENDEAVWIYDITFASEAGAPTTGPKKTPCGVESVLYNTIPITITDYNYTVDNSVFWADVADGFRFAALLVRDCTASGWDDTSRYYYSETGINFSGGLVSPGDDAEAARFEMAGSFKGRVVVMDTPAGVFPA